MGVFKVVGSAMMTEAEAAHAPPAPPPAPPRPHAGIPSLAGIAPAAAAGPGGGPLDSQGFQAAPIVPNGPLTIQILHLYTGKFPKGGGGLFGGGGDGADMLVTSALKDYAAFAPASRAINFLSQNVQKGQHLTRPKATEQGTPVIAYYPAVLSDSLTLTVEMAFDSFDDAFASGLGQAFTNLAGIPVFLPFAGYLLAAGSLVRLAGNLADKLTDGQPKLAETLVLNFNPSNGPVTPAEIYVMCAADFPRDGYRFDFQKGIVDAKTGQPYGGDQPYVVLLIDGAERDDLRDFAPTAASSALIQKFLAGKPGSEVAIDAFVDAVKLWNDFQYRQQADKLQKQLAAPGLTPDGQAALQRKLKAAIANIQDDTLKPAGADGGGG